VWRGEEGGGVERREGWRAQLGREAVVAWLGREVSCLGFGGGRRIIYGDGSVGCNWAGGGRGGPNFLCREPTNLALDKETILIKLIIKNGKLM
jgi:hypothetical protein